MHALDVTKKTRVSAVELAHGGYVKVQKLLGEAVNETSTNILGQQGR